MFHELKRHDRIFVVGPQRSGTRIAATMIAYDTGHAMIDERVFACDCLSRFYEIVRESHGGQVVIQAPGMTRWIHKFAEGTDAVVFMMRDLAAIRASEKRIGWEYEYVEAVKYGADDMIPSAEKKQSFWRAYQSHNIRNAYTIAYNTLVAHPLWVHNRRRSDFAWDQTECVSP